MENNIGCLLSKRAELNPDREALVDVASQRRFTYRESNQRVNRLANGFLSLGVTKGKRVAILHMNSIEFVETFFALAKIGAVLVPLNWRLTAQELNYILTDSGATTLLFGAEFDDVIAELRESRSGEQIRTWISTLADSSVPADTLAYDHLMGTADTDEPQIDVQEDDLLYIVYTSGTTGRPKGAVHTHNSAFWASATVTATVLFHEDDRYLLSLPMFHVGALTPLLNCVYTGITCVLMRSFDPAGVLTIIQHERITTMLAVPAMLNLMLQTLEQGDYDTGSLRWCMCGTAPVPVALIEACHERGIRIFQTYGLTECGGPACMLNADYAVARAGSTGKAFFHTSVRLADDKGNDPGPNQPGEILIAGKHLMKEYWNLPEATRETIVDGWLRTGDLAEKDEEGFIYIRDRIKDMIISGGENIYPAELENAILAHDKVSDVAVIGQPSPKWGESPLAVVVRKDDSLTADELLAWCQGRLARYKQPKHVEFVDTIPRNPTGKALKSVLRKSFPGPAAE